MKEAGGGGILTATDPLQVCEALGLRHPGVSGYVFKSRVKLLIPISPSFALMQNDPQYPDSPTFHSVPEHDKICDSLSVFAAAQEVGRWES